MTELLLIFWLAGLLVFTVVALGRYLAAREWRRCLIAYRLQLPASLSADDVTTWLGNVQATTHAPKWAIVPLPPVALEVVATNRGVAFYLLVAASAEAKTLAGLRGSLPGVRVEAMPRDFVTTRPLFAAAAELRVTNTQRPLAFDRAEATATNLLAALQPLTGADEIHLQYIFVSAGTPTPPRLPATRRNTYSWQDLQDNLVHDSEELRAVRQKQASPHLNAAVRVGVVCQSRSVAYSLFGRIWSIFHMLNAPGVRLVRRWLPSSMVASRMRHRVTPLIRWSLLVSTRELTGMLALPIGTASLPGVSLGSARQLAPSPHLPMHGQVVAMSNYPGMENRPLALTAEDRTRHSYIVGPAGSGKSVLLTRLICNDIQAGYGVFACDPKGDLIAGILERLNDQDAERVIVLDASKRDRPIGLNVLGNAQTEEARELVVDGVLHVFREMWSSFWGPRTDQVLRSALSTLINVRAPDGSAMTICEVVPLLTNSAFRRYVTSRDTLPSNLREYWARFERMSDNELMQAIAPVLNKVEAFTQRTPIRLMLGQSQGINLTQIFSERKAVLVNLAKGDIGTETGNLLGALIVYELWKATLARVRIPLEKRHPAFAYIDEAQDIVRLPLPIADMLAQARGFKLGITLANQYLMQLPEAVRAAVLGTVKTQIAFAVEHDDARILEKRFSPLTADDLSGLPAFELAMRPCVGAQTLPPVTGQSMPLPEPINDSQRLAVLSRERYGVARADVEVAIERRTAATIEQQPIGRRPRPGGTA